MQERPELTVIIAAVDDYQTIFEALRAVEEQSALKQLELLVVLNTLGEFRAPADFAALHPRARIIEVHRPLLLHEARAIGVENAGADYVFLLEDHCLPTRDCLAMIIARIREGCWSVIGPGIESGNRHSVDGQAANLLTYGQWMGYKEAEERHFVSGYSSAWRCASLRPMAPYLEQALAIPSRLQERMRRSGERLFFEPQAIMLHWEASRLRDICRILFRQGVAMGFIRRGESGFARKAIGSLLVLPLILHRTLRGWRAWHRTRSQALRILFVIPLLAIVWCAGELKGYWTRHGRQALRGVSEVERKRQPFVDAVHEPIRLP
ncbi:MAG TPA: glycosyltransferase [Acidobacteriota bacterium]|nr:glycosyltransferase [Acidobacteriota bacterium]